MQYRNDTSDPLTVTTEPPVLVEPGDVVDVDDHVAGLTPVDEELADDERAEPAADLTDLADAYAPADDKQQDEDLEATR